MKSVYEECPVLENEEFQLRLFQMEDAGELLKVYSDVKAVPFFNSDNCNGDNFYYDSVEKMTNAAKFWCNSYKIKAFVRFSIVHKKTNQVIGTVELFNRRADDYYNNCGLLRLDIRSDYETEAAITHILTILISNTYKMFECDKIATKAIPEAVQRIQALTKAGFVSCEQKLRGHDGTEYKDYWVTTKK